MSLHKVFDAATPPATVPPGCEGVLGYVGGGRAYRVWTLADWAPFHNLRQFPCWVPPIGSDPAAEAARAVAAVKERGWAAFMPEPETRVIVCDLETSHDAAWWQKFAAEVMLGGFVAVAYGSLATVGDNLASDVWVADFDGLGQLVPGQTVHAKQDQAEISYLRGVVDYSVADNWMMARGGRGPRH